MGPEVQLCVTQSQDHEYKYIPPPAPRGLIPLAPCGVSRHFSLFQNHGLDKYFHDRLFLRLLGTYVTRGVLLLFPLGSWG